MHFVNAKSILNKHGINIYRGCSHGCIYCDSRSKCYQFAHEFEDIEVKQNAPELLEEALRKKRKRCMIGTGSMGDPYIPAEKELCITRHCLEVIEKYNFGAAVLTKSDLVLRDIDILSRIGKKTRAIVQMTLTTYDDALSKILEPGVCPTSRRFDALKACRDEGIETVVWFTPLLPYINDTKENIAGIVDYCVRAGVSAILCFGMGVTLREGNREYYYSALDRNFPNLKERYIKSFGNSYMVSSPDERELMAYLSNLCRKNNIMLGAENIFDWMNKFPESEHDAAYQQELF